MNSKKLKLAPCVIKRYEERLNLYFFYNAKNKFCWHCDYATGTIISTLDGSLSADEIIDIIEKNNPSESNIKETLLKTFDILNQKGFLDVEN